MDNRSEMPVWTMFTAFLTNKNERALESKMRMMSLKPDSQSANDSKIQSASKGKSSWSSTTIATVRSNLTLAQVTTREELNQFISEAKKN